MLGSSVRLRIPESFADMLAAPRGRGGRRRLQNLRMDRSGHVYGFAASTYDDTRKVLTAVYASAYVWDFLYRKGQAERRRQEERE